MSAKSSMVLVINAGSSSLKFQLFQLGQQEVMLAKGQAERIGLSGPVLSIKCADGREWQDKPAIANHEDAIKLICGKLADPA